MITKRRKERETNSSYESRTLLDLLIEAKDHEGDGRGFSDVEVGSIYILCTYLKVRDNIITFLLAGHETTASAMAWFMYHVSSNPTVENKVREELERVLQGNPIEVHHLKELPYFEAVRIN